MPKRRNRVAELQERLDQLEQEAAKLTDSRCPTCVHWPPSQVRHFDTDGSLLIDSLVPDQCPDCGWQPIKVALEYENRPPDWQARKVDGYPSGAPGDH